MRRLILISAALILCHSVAAQVDSATFAKLDSALLGYIRDIKPTPLETKKAECDFLISSSQLPAVQQRVALTLFDNYKEADVMGDEAVAIHIFDKWLASGKIPFRSEFDQMQAELFANFNRSSLLGMQAPALNLKKANGKVITVPARGKPTIMFFYDTACAKCKVETKLLPGVLEKVGFKADVCMVYAGSDAKAWKAFRKGFKVRNRKVRMIHLWDPDSDSDYPRMYGVIATPKMFFISSGSEILGRRLELDSLLEVINLYSLYLSEYEQGKEQKH